MATLTETTRAAAALSNDEVLRYSRHLIMPEVGMDGQLKLKAAKVLCVGAGGLGSPLALYLAAAGVGTLGMVDFDVVDFTNLQRQIIHTTADVGRKKLDSAADKLLAINPNVNIVKFDTRLSSANALEIFRDFDMVVDGTDNFPTRYLVNDACVLTGKPNVYGSIFRFEGQVSIFATKEGPCYRCLYPEPPPPGLVPSCAEGGVLGILPGLVGVMQATEAIKLILGAGEPLIGRLLLVDALAMRFRELKLRKNPDCPVVRNPSDDQGADRLQRVLRNPRRRKASGNTDAQHHRGRTETDARRRQGAVPARRSRTARISDLQSRRTPHSAQRSSEARQRTGFESRDRRPLQDGWTQREGGRLPAAVRIHQSEEISTGGINAWAEKIDPTMPKY